jgi:hypothetical protein
MLHSSLVLVSSRDCIPSSSHCTYHRIVINSMSSLSFIERPDIFKSDETDKTARDRQWAVLLLDALILTRTECQSFTFDTIILSDPAD